MIDWSRPFTLDSRFGLFNGRHLVFDLRLNILHFLFLDQDLLPILSRFFLKLHFLQDLLLLELFKLVLTKGQFGLPVIAFVEVNSNILFWDLLEDARLKIVLFTI